MRVRVRSQGLAGQTGRLVLRLGDEEVDDANIAFGPDGEQVISSWGGPSRHAQGR